MKIALDTTYFLHGFNIAPKESIPKNCLDLFTQSDKISEIIFSDMVIFELNAKASKFLSNCRDLDEKTEYLINLNKKYKFNLALSYNKEIWHLACFLRQFHKDYIDCVHWATALKENVAIFVTEDENITELVKKSEFIELFTKEFHRSQIDVKNFTQINQLLK